MQNWWNTTKSHKRKLSHHMWSITFQKNRDKQNAIYISTICLIFSDGKSAANYCRKPKNTQHKIKVKFTCNSGIYLENWYVSFCI